MIITPIPGVRLETILPVLRAALTGAQNLGSSYSTADECLLNYLTWTTEQARLLGSHVRPKDVEAFFFTPVYWALLNGAGHVEGRLVPKVSIGLVTEEVRQRAEDLERAASAIADAMRRWPGDVATLVLDTSFFIEHEHRLEDADFFGLAAFDGQVRVVVPMAVVDEMDRLKESRVSPHARWRARYGLAVLDRLVNGTGRLGFTEVEVLPDPPGHVRLPDEDDEIVDRALALRTIAAGPVSLVTYDTGMALRAKIADMPCLKLRQELGPEPEKK